MTTSERAVHRHSGRRAWRTVAALLAAFALIGAACGSDDGDDDAAEAPAATEAAPAPTTEAAPAPTTEAAPSGEPIKVMTVTTLNAAGPTYHNIANTANAYADYINARGGIAGRPL
ncbi:MAG: hypothetical protein OXH86_12390 [Acidimicrobiaceae bacterium]|nr:hypothetical protein [Acidimicrobiaceae bacterium]